jgi:hypothetical protein
MSTQENAQLIADTAKAFELLTPLLGPYGPPVLLGLKALELAAPLIYARVVSLLAKGEVTPEEAAELREMIGRLKNPGDYFADKPAV